MGLAAATLTAVVPRTRAISGRAAAWKHWPATTITEPFLTMPVTGTTPAVTIRARSLRRTHVTITLPALSMSNQSAWAAATGLTPAIILAGRLDLRPATIRPRVFTMRK